MRPRLVALIVAGAVGLAACSSSDPDDTSAPGSSDAEPVATTDDRGAAPTTALPPNDGDDDDDGGGTGGAVAPPESVAPVADWGPCPDDIPQILGAPPIECATIEVPLDHADPDGPSIPIALMRQPAPGDPIGSLVFNPGGPGGSGLEFLAAARFGVPDEIARRFDLVSFDPRGVGASASVTCDLMRDDGIALVADDDRAAWDDLLERSLSEIDTCTTSVDGLAAYLGTNSAARDLDAIRAAVGDELLTYVGFSYGTRLGATYAELFPDRIRALVLDGAVLPTTDFDELGAGQAAGFDAALETFAAACDADADCLLRELGPTLEVIDGLRLEIGETRSFPTDDPARVVTPGELDLAIVSALYSRSAWVYLSQALYLSEVRQDGTLLQVLADSYLGRQVDGSYNNQPEANAFINCADDPERPDADEVWASADALADPSVHFADFLRASTGCLGIDDPIDPLLLGPADGAPPVLVIGTTGDPATPYEWSVEMAEFLDSGVLYTVEGEGHTAYLGIECVEPVVNAYLLELELPGEGGSCVDDSDDDPFPPSGESDLERVVAFVDCLADEGVETGDYDLADALADPSGLELFSELFSDPAAMGGLLACQSLLPG